jgi:hypothetical protein
LVVEDSTPDSTPFVVDATGRLIVGSTTALTYSNSLSIVPNLQLNALGSVTAGISRFAPNSAGNSCWFLKSRGATAGAFDVVASGDTLGTIGFLGADGTDGIQAATISAQVDGTPGTNDMPGRLVFSTTADGASSPTERMRIDSAGSVGIGGTPSPWARMHVTGTYLSSGGVSIANYSTGAIPSTTTSSAAGFWSEPSTQAATFTLGSVRHFTAHNLSIGAGSTVTNQYGYFANSSLTGATNNFGFYSNIASGSGRYNFYAAGTADNYFAGKIGIGGVPTTFVSADIQGTYPAGSFTRGFRAAATIPSSVIGNARLFSTEAYTQAASFTLGSLTHYLALQQTIGAGSTVTNQYGFSAETTLTGATNNFGFYSNIASGSGRYNFYAAGTADNYFAGKVGIGIVPAPSTQIYAYHISTDATSYGFLSSPVVGSSTTNSFATYQSNLSTQAASFTTASAIHFLATQGTIGAGSTVTNQYGYFANSNLTGATNNYGFYSNIASGSGRYNFYAAGTARNYFAGTLNLGDPSDVGAAQFNNLSISGSGGVGYGIKQHNTALSSVTSTFIQNQSVLYTQAASFTLSTYVHFAVDQGAIGAGSTVTNQYGFLANSSLTGATNNYGFYSNIASGSGRYNFYAAGNAANYFAGNTGIGSTSPESILHVRQDQDGTTRTIIHNRNATGTPLSELTFITSTFNFSDNRYAYIQSGGGGSNYLAFGTSNGATLTEKMRITATGSVGIGTAAPGGLFHVSAGASSVVSIIENAGGTNAYLVFRNSVTTANNVRFGAESAAFVAYTGGAVRLTISSTGEATFTSSIKSNTTIAGGYTAPAAGTTAMALGSNKVVKVTPDATATFTTTVAPAGATASIIIVTSGTTSYTITFGTGFLTTGTLATGTVTAKTFVVNFVSDGTTMIETSRTVAM